MIGRRGSPGWVFHLPVSVVRLPREIRNEVLRQIPVYLFVEAGLRIIPLPLLARLLGVGLDVAAWEQSGGPPEGGIAVESRDSSPAPGGQPPAVPGSDASVLRAAAVIYRRRRPGGSCLSRALVVGRRLRHQRPVLRIGVPAAPSGGPRAHAWLEIRGVAFEDVGGFVALKKADVPRRPDQSTKPPGVKE